MTKLDNRDTDRENKTNFFSRHQIPALVKRIDSLEERLHALESKCNTADFNFITIAGYSQLTNQPINFTTAINLGRKAKAECARLNIKCGKVWDVRFGWVSSYPAEILERIFKHNFETNLDATNG